MKKLDSWKEIAKYLDRNVRTCQRWEQELGLPVHRLDKTIRSRVFCYSDEIDNWIKDKLNNLENNQKRFPKFNWRILKPLAISIVVLVFLSSLIIFLPKMFDRNPSDFQILDSNLFILNKYKKPLWEFDTGIRTLESEAHYKSRFQKKRPSGPYHLPYIIIEDINDDNSNETLFIIKNGDNKNENILICFSKTGKELWRFNAGDEIDEKQVFSDTYEIIGFGTDDLNNDGTYEVIVITNHRYSFASQTVILDSIGVELGEYWNAGNIYDFGCIDLDADGIKELILVGANEDWNRPCCAILDFSCTTGTSPKQDNSYKFRIMDNCYEKFYILMPVDAAKKILKGNCFIQRLSLFEDNPNDFLKFENLISFIFNSKLELSSIHFYDRFMLAYQTTKRKGGISKDIYQLKDELLDEGPLYFDGQNWTKVPTMVRYWIDKNK